MIQLIQRNWNSKQQVAGETLVKFTIQRDGRRDQRRDRAVERLFRPRPDGPARVARHPAAAAAAGTIHRAGPHRPSHFPVRALMLRRRFPALVMTAAALGATVVIATQNPPSQPPAQPPPAPPQPGEVQLRSPASPGRRRSTPFLISSPLSGDAETKAAAKTIGEVLWDDLDFEREFYMIPRDTYAAIPPAPLGVRRPVRSLARAGRRRPGDWHRAERRHTG